MEQNNSPSAIYLIRHGETPWSLSGQHTGNTDISLTENGRKQVEKLKNRLAGCSFEKVFVSPLKRAQETCSLAGFGSSATVDPDLAEWDYGTYEGLTTAEILQRDPAWNLFLKGAPSGEAPEDIEKRLHRLILNLQTISGNVALFSHGHLLRSLTTLWLQLPLIEGRRFVLHPASVSILGYEHSKRALVLWNLSH